MLFLINKKKIGSKKKKGWPKHTPGQEGTLGPNVPSKSNTYKFVCFWSFFPAKINGHKKVLL
jgi:hypothetical protein